ncbi:hypothetical protein ACX0AN_003721 [Acinetobacter baumannii]|nr:hypothetical protein [Acinetobacter baumannii]MDV7422485.1 hypothetical protein [Acinetobacter baumannii]
MQFSDWVQLVFMVFLTVAIIIKFIVSFHRDLRYQQDDDQYIP